MAIKTQTRKFGTVHTRFWHVRLVNKQGEYHSHPGWIVRVDQQGGVGFNPDTPEKVERSWKEAVAKVQKNLDNGPGGEVEGWELTVNILEWHWGKDETVAELY